jgi:hypothetical protein
VNITQRSDRGPHGAHAPSQPHRTGDVECLGVELCEPCLRPQQLTRRGIIKDLIYRGGLRADILSGDDQGRRQGARDAGIALSRIKACSH